MERWHLPTVEAAGVRDPQVLFSSDGARGVLIDLGPGEELGDHSVRERAIVHVVGGVVEMESDGRAVQCDAGSLVVFAPRERHTVRALEHARVLLVLAPWPAADPYQDGREHDATRTPARATAPPMQP